MITAIGHVGILVKNLDLEKPAYKDWPDEGMKHAVLKIGNEAIELMEPYPDSNLAKTLETRGEGVQHINFTVNDVQETVKSLKEKGIKVIEGQNSSFIHPKETKGVLIELAELE